MLKLGKLPARKDAVQFKFKELGSKVPAAPSRGGNRILINGDNNMFGNDQLGDCVCAEAAHGTLFYNAMAGKKVSINTDTVVAMYSAVTGYKPGDESTDNGTDMQAAASWRRKVGLADASGKRHQILAYLDLGVGVEATLKQSIYYFGGAGVGFEFPGYAMDEFNAGQTWHIKAGSVEGGHDVFAYAYDATYVYVISWGKPVRMTWGFFKKYCDEALVYLTSEMLVNGKNANGLDVATLQNYLTSLK